MSVPNAIEVVTLFVDDITQAKAFYEWVFEPEVIHQDDVSCVLSFEGMAVNLLRISEASQLIEPASATPSTAGPRVLLTIKVADVDATCATLRDRRVDLLNGPADRPSGRRTAAFMDPFGHVWEVAQERS